VAGQQRQPGQRGHLADPLRRGRAAGTQHLHLPVVGPAADHHALVGGQVRVGQQGAVGDGVHRDAAVGHVPGERVDDQAEAQQVSRPAAVEIGHPDHLGQVGHRARGGRVGTDAPLDRVEYVADPEAHADLLLHAGTRPYDARPGQPTVGGWGSGR
jgi:hypothetical protein